MDASLLDQAVAALRERRGLQVSARRRTSAGGEVHLMWKGKDLKFTAQTQKTLRLSQIPAIAARREAYPDLLIVAEYLPDNVKSELREMGVAYAEPNGNVYMASEDVYLWIETEKPEKPEKPAGNRAFTRTGLKVVLQLLMSSGLVNRPHRTIAAAAGVALGNIPQVIAGLKDTGYLIPFDQHTLIWENRSGLLQRWIDAYETILKPSLYIGRFSFGKNSNWQTLPLGQGHAVWGGEPGAALLTGVLHPEQLLLFTTQRRSELLARYRLLPDPEGEVAVLAPCWPLRETDLTAPPIVIYADLIISGESRNIATARQLFHELIEPNL